MAPKVLISDKLSDAAVQIFRDRGIEVDFRPELGKDKDALLSVIGNYDGLAIRSATKATEKLIAAADNLKVIGRGGVGLDNGSIVGPPRTSADRAAPQEGVGAANATDAAPPPAPPSPCDEQKAAIRSLRSSQHRIPPVR